MAIICCLFISQAGLAINADVPDLKDLASISSENLSDFQITSLKNQIMNLDDKTYDGLIAELVWTTSDYKSLQKTLEKVGVELSDPKELNDQNSIQRIPPYDGNIVVYSNKRVTDSYYRLFAEYSLSTVEPFPKSADVIILYYDSTKATYYDYNAESRYSSLRSGQYATSGTLAFNFYDDIAFTNYSYSAVYVTPKSGTSGQWLDYGADFVHTYTEYEVSGTFTTSLKFGGTGLVGGSIGCSVTVSPNHVEWSIADLNAVRI